MGLGQLHRTHPEILATLLARPENAGVGPIALLLPKKVRRSARQRAGADARALCSSLCADRGLSLSLFLSLFRSPHLSRLLSLQSREALRRAAAGSAAAGAPAEDDYLGEEIDDAAPAGSSARASAANGARGALASGAAPPPARAPRESDFGRRIRGPIVTQETSSGGELAFFLHRKHASEERALPSFASDARSQLSRSRFCSLLLSPACLDHRPAPAAAARAPDLS